MKKVFLSLLTIVLISCGSIAQEGKEIGVVEDGQYVITVNESFLDEHFETVLKAQNIDAKLIRYEIISDKNDSGEYYMLIGYNKNNSVKSAFRLKLENDKFRAQFNYNTVTCNGCTSGCHPHADKSGWNCDDPCESCSKSETISY